jgi:DNA polymerase III subunit delta'
MVPSLSAIFSQDRAVGLLRNAIHEQRLPHALIFAGPAGVGKRSTADALAAILLCPQSKDAKPCGHCESCRLMSAGNHPDFHLVYRQLIRLEKEDSKARELSALVIRDYLIKPANHHPNMNHGKVFVVEEAELMNAAAQNTLLKTLEEPPRDTFIILLTDQPGALLPTIRSRCQTIPFGSIDPKALSSELTRRNLIDSASAAFFAEGSLGHAIQWSQQGIIQQAEVLRQQIEQMLAGRDVNLADILKKSADAYADEQLKTDKLASKDQAMHDGLAIYLRLASLILRQLFRQQTDPDRLERLCQAIESIAEAEINLQANVNVSLSLMNWEMAMEKELHSLT